MNIFNNFRWASSTARFIGILIIVSFTLFPFLVVVGTSLKTMGEVFRSPATLIPEVVVWKNYVDIFVRIPMVRHLVNTIIIAGSVTILNICVSAPAAYAIARVNFAGRGVFGLGILITQMVLTVIIIIPLFKVMKTLGFLNTYASLIFVNLAFVIPFSIWMLTGFFRNIPEEL